MGASIHGQILVFGDPFGDGSITNNSVINTDQANRQSGSVSSTYTHVGGSSGTLISNNDSITTGNNMARLRNNEQNGAGSNGFLVLDSDFESALGQAYTINFDFYYTKRSTSTTDQWVGFTIGDTLANAGNPTPASTNFGMLLRPDGVGNTGVGDNFARFYSGSSFNVANDSTSVPSYASAYVTFQVSVIEDGTGGALVDVTAGGNTLISDLSVNFANGSRYFGFGSHLGPDINGDNATEFSDLYIDNLTITTVPEPRFVAILAGFAVLVFVIRRRMML